MSYIPSLKPRSRKLMDVTKTVFTHRPSISDCKRLFSYQCVRKTSLTGVSLKTVFCTDYTSLTGYEG